MRIEAVCRCEHERMSHEDYGRGVRGACTYIDCSCRRYRVKMCTVHGSPRASAGSWATPAEIMAGEMECPGCGRTVAVMANGGIRPHKEPPPQRRMRP